MVKARIFITFAIFVMLALNLASAMTLKSVSIDTVSPGEEAQLFIEIENTLEDDAEDISLKLNLENLPFTVVGSSESSIDELLSDDEENFAFTIKASNNVKPGDYNIPYTLSYKINSEQKQRSGLLGLTIKANPELSFTLSQEKPILGQQDKITLKIVNKGFGEARFLTLRIFPDGYTLLSDSEVYIGTIDSDDFETASFDIIYKKSPLFTAAIEYRDFDNNKITQTVNLPLTVYTQEEALQLGLIKKNNVPLYIGVAIILIVAFFVYRSIRKRRRLARSRLRR